MPKVSIIIPTWNSERYLERCLLSIQRQSFSDYEIIIADRRSTDKTLSIANKFGCRITTDGKERSEQFNAGALIAKGDYFFRVDSDFELEPTVVEECLSLCKNGTDAVVVHNSPDTSMGILSKIRNFEISMYKFDLTHSATRFFSRELFNDIGGYDPNITAGEDYDFQNRINKKGYKTLFAQAEALHLGEEPNLWKILKKYYWYGRDFKNYITKNRLESISQLTFFRSIYWKKRNSFLRHPLYGFMFIIYHFLKYAAGGIGYIFESIHTIISNEK